MIHNGYPWRKSKKESFTAHYKLISHAPFRIKKKQHSPMWSFSLQRLLCTRKYKWIVTQRQWSFTTDLLQLASHVIDHFYLKNKFILCPEFGERSQNICKREVLHHFIIQTFEQLCFTWLKGQQRFYLLNKIKRNHLQLTASFFTTLLWIKDKGSDLRSFSEQSPRLSNFWISWAVILLKKF
jgi:hypothetical protein